MAYVSYFTSNNSIQILYRSYIRMPLTEKQKYAIIIKHEDGKTKTAIANELSISRITVSNWIKRYTETNDIKRKIGSGRKKS